MRTAQRLGYTAPVVEEAFSRLFSSITKNAITSVITDELGSVQALDGFTRRKGRPPYYARGVDRVAIIASDTTIGVAIPSLIFALCAKVGHITIKDRDDHLTASFAQTLIEQEPALAHALTIQPWENHDDPGYLSALAQADVVIVFGGDETMRSIRARCKPGARFLPFGHRTSLCHVPREALTDETAAYSHARDIAVDALLYDGEGCLSTHAVFVEAGAPVSPAAFAAIFARACDEVTTRFPYAHRTVAPNVAAYRDRALFRAAQGLGAIHGATDGITHLIVFSPSIDEPPPFLPRTVGVYPIDEPAEMLAFVRRHALPLEAIAGLPKAREDLTERYLATGASRITTLGRLQDPPLTGNHGGYGRITPFVRCISYDL